MVTISQYTSQLLSHISTKGTWDLTTSIKKNMRYLGANLTTSMSEAPKF